MLLTIAVALAGGTCFVGEAYHRDRRGLVQIEVEETRVLFTEAGETEEHNVDLRDGGFVATDGTGSGAATVDGGILWRFADGGRAVAYPAACGASAAPARRVVVALQVDSPRDDDDDWAGGAIATRLERGNVDITVVDSLASVAPDTDYTVHISDIVATVKEGSSNHYTATAGASVAVRRLVRTASGVEAFDIGGGPVEGDSGFGATEYAYLERRGAVKDVLSKISAWLDTFSELGFRMTLLEVDAIGAELSWGAEDGVSKWDRYAVYHGARRLGVVRVSSVSKDGKTSRGIFERRALGWAFDGTEQLRLTSHGAQWFLAGHLGLPVADIGIAADVQAGLDVFAAGPLLVVADVSLGTTPLQGVSNFVFQGEIMPLLQLGGISAGLSAGAGAGGSKSQGEFLFGSVDGVVFIPVTSRFSATVRGRYYLAAYEPTVMVGVALF